MTTSTNRPLRTPKNHWWWLPSVITVLVLIAIWEAAVDILAIRASVLPAPSRVFTQAVAHFPDLATHTLATLTVTLIGFGASLLVSWVIAITIDFHPRLRQAVMPLLVASQTIPLIVIAPLMILWFGFGLLPKVLLVILVTFFPTTLGLIEGFASTPSTKTDLLTSLDATAWQQFRLLRLPSAMPSFFTSLRISITYAVVGTIFAEYAGSSSGLGVYLALQRNSFRTDLVLAAVIMIALLSLALFGLAALAQRLIAPWTLKLDDRHRR
jgi:ABC-type nitrate/sulfonate/bicarbonate transport system permease component